MEIGKESLLYSECSRWDYVDRYRFAVADPGDRIGLSDLAGSVRRARALAGLRGCSRCETESCRFSGSRLRRREERMLPGTVGNGSRENGSGYSRYLPARRMRIVLGDNDRHLDLRVSLLVERGGRDRAGKDAERDDRRPAERPAGAGLFLLYQAVSQDDRSRRRKAEPAPAGIGGSRRKRRRIANGADGPGRSAIRSATVRPLAARKRSSWFGRNGFSDRPEKNRSVPR